MTNGLNNRLSKLEARNGELRIAIPMLDPTHRNDRALAFQWHANGRNHGDPVMITRIANEAETSHFSRAVNVVNATARDVLPNGAIPLPYGAHLA